MAWGTRKWDRFVPHWDNNELEAIRIEKIKIKGVMIRPKVRWIARGEKPTNI